MLAVDQIENKYIASFYNMSRLNILNSKDIEKQLLPLISQAESTLTLNFAGIKFIDSSGFETLIRLKKTAKAYKSSLSLINMSEDLRELVNLVKLDSVLQLN